MQPHFFPQITMDLSTLSSPTDCSSHPSSTQGPAAPTSPGSWPRSSLNLTGPGWAWWVLTMATWSGCIGSCRYRSGSQVAVWPSHSEGESISITATATASRPAATVIICDRYHFHFRLLPETLWENNVTSRIWIFCASFTYSPSVLSPEALDLLNGSLSLTIHSGIMPSFEDFLLALHLAMYPGKSGEKAVRVAAWLQVVWIQGFQPKSQERSSMQMKKSSRILDPALPPVR